MVGNQRINSAVSYFAAATTFLAASVEVIGRDDRQVRLSSMQLLARGRRWSPPSRTTSGTGSVDRLDRVDDALRAMVSHFMMPPKILTRIAFTFLSATRILKASVTC